MPAVDATRLARADLDDVWNWIAAEDPDAADRVLRDMDSLIETLARFPELGRHRPA